jgi:hypothetical protein
MPIMGKGDKNKKGCLDEFFKATPSREGGLEIVGDQGSCLLIWLRVVLGVKTTTLARPGFAGQPACGGTR